MSDVDISPEVVEKHICTVGEVGTEQWYMRNAELLRALRTELTATQEKLAAAESLFSECAIARDNVGFVGTVPECIAYMDAQLTTAQAKFVALAFAVENGRRGAFSDDKTEALVDKVLAAFNTQEKP